MAVDDLLYNALMLRKEVFSSLIDPRRDINDECGYPESMALTAEMYRDMYDRDGIAARVVEVLPKETWQVQPTVYEEEDSETVTPFEEAWDNLSRTLRGQSWYQDEEGSPIWEYLERVDILSGIGHYGVLFLGLDDVESRDQLREPVEGFDEKSLVADDEEFRSRFADRAGPTVVGGKKIDVDFTRSETDSTSDKPERRLLFVRAFDEQAAQISTFNNDETSPRFGFPEIYQLTFNDPRNEGTGLAGPPETTLDVHWSRVIHFADNMMTSEIFGVPRMRPVFNRLYDLQKLYGGSAEMYWRGAFPGLSIETHPQLGGDVDVDKAGMRDMMEQYMNGLQRYLNLMGMSAKSLAPQVVDPTPQIEAELQAICIRIGVPKRIFMGSERGELASSQDDSTWNDRLMTRRRQYVTPRVIIPFVDRLIHLKVLPRPVGFSVDWPEPITLTPVEQAEVTLKRTQSMVAYAAGGEAVMAPHDYLTRELKYNEDEATEIVEAATEAVEEKQEEMDARAEEFGVNPETGTPMAIEEATAEKLKNGGGDKPFGGK